MSIKIASIVLLTFASIILALRTAAPALANSLITHCNNDTQLSNALAGGGKITFNCGKATIILSSTKEISKNMTIDGGKQITLSGNNARRLFEVDTGATLRLDNITIKDGFSSTYNGGAIRNDGTLYISNSKFLNNHVTNALVGGAIFSFGTLGLSTSLFRNNQAGSGGAVYVSSVAGSLLIEHSRFIKNQATATDGIAGALGVEDHATADIAAGTIFSENKADYGGAIYAQTGSTVTISIGNVIENNTAGGRSQ